MLKCVLIYLWVYIGLFGVLEAGDADEHVHIKLHMPKTSIRKSVRHHHHPPPPHIRRKKNPPPYASPHPPMPPASLPPPSAVSGPGATHTHIYHETAHNYLTAGTQPSGPHYMPDHHHMKKLPTASSVTQLHATAPTSHQQQPMETEIYVSEDGSGPTMTLGEGAEAEALGVDGDYMSYLSANFAAFPQPTTLESEIISTPTASSELAYHQKHQHQQQHHHTVSVRSEEGLRHNNHRPFSYYQKHQFDAPAASVVATNHELEEDNEILGSLGRTSTLMEPNGWTPQHHHHHHHFKPHGGLASSSAKALKNEHLLKQILQQQQHEQDKEEQQHPYPSYQTEIANTPTFATSSSLLRSRNKHRDDKLHQAMATASGVNGDDGLDIMNTYEEMDMATGYSSGGGGGGSQRGTEAGSNDERGIKALTVDDIWSQLQRTYLSKYTPQAQPAIGLDDVDEDDAVGERLPLTPSRKLKRNSQRLKTKKRHYHPRTAAPTSATVQSVNYESNYYNQEHDGKPSTFYDNHTPQSSSYGTAFAAPFSQFFPARDLFATRASTVTVRPFNSFQTLSHFDAATNDEDTAEEDDSLQGHIVSSGGHDDGGDDDDDGTQSDDNSSEESMFSSTAHKKLGSNRSHRHSHGNVAYGHANLNNNFFNYQDLYASYSTPIAAATIATHTNGQQQPAPSTYHPNSYGATAQTATTPNVAVPYQQQIVAPGQHESTSYQWREQQHYPAASYQSYHTSALHRPQAQPQQQHQRPTPALYQPPTSSALRLPKATVASTAAALSASLSQRPLFSPSSSSSSSSPLSSSSLSLGLSTNDFTSAVKESNGQQSQQQQQRYKKRKNRQKSKRNRIVVL